MRIHAAFFAAIAAFLMMTACDTTQPLDTSGESHLAMLSVTTLNTGQSTLWDLWTYGYDDFPFDGIAEDLDGDGEPDAVAVVCVQNADVNVNAIPTHFTVEIELIAPDSTNVVLLSPVPARRDVLNNLSIYDDNETVLDNANAPAPPFSGLTAMSGVQASGTSRSFFTVLGETYIEGIFGCPTGNVANPGTAGIGIDPAGSEPPPPTSSATDYCLIHSCRNAMPFEVEMEKGSTLVVNIRRSDLLIPGLFSNSPSNLSLAANFTVDGEAVTLTGNTQTDDPTGSIQFVYKSE